MTIFCNWLVQKQHSHAVVCAHNASRFDSYFTLKQLLSSGVKIVDIVVNGGQIYFFRIGTPYNLRFIDSARFLPCSLAKLPKMFGMNSDPDLSESICKGWFPHLFNTTDRVANNYVGPMPSMESFNPDDM